MNTAKYLLAKYIPDLRRGEPRNIGIIVWSPDGVEARFLAEKENQSGVVDGRSVPSFVTSLSAYKQWVEYWRNEIQKSEVEPAIGGSPTARHLPEFTDALKTANKGNFALEDGGFLMDKVDPEDLPRLTEHLFSALVETNGQDEPRDLTLDEACDDLLETSKLNRSPYFRNSYSLRCPVDHFEEEFVFSHAFKNGSLERLYQRVSFPKKKKTMLRKNVHDAAWKFEKVIQANIIPANKTVTLVYVSEDQQGESEVARSLNVLSQVSKVFNLRDQQPVLHEFQQLALIQD